ncbi:hypothetical protein TGPRC2_252255 [Toxoplasma gondii TgCatPRC2]|uniref:Uncharacterized protein n=12 Tax=Toxoplasma gondii TaxID=5811 RepID=A0A125YTQ4_TOXGV|nr:hypothetical protein TGGT1_252255 [Toxoplasma gondii GT1]ESS30238.1 hypothetical protein TGVEG_252255 [Toxoplasma gondii VEG]KAF4645456.1 hypothetical protein TGRH88_005600 [Toxoplasma gondii]KFG29679.1 hypothetical protein TGDOM2_252255 [Toxoplasma gondii GAB2-2007-GAL-DOM2]KFG37183.1 hypothetical protein TGFOU_252255 [Toxoplasma gondii FOU]KFG47392.1 hypothetical protein TGP89_252255 [Toxoplasma gondii p89]KFG57956.1 hypothetical protein TGRUB_252255 [Toxoplasma gondii RUB]KFH02350.1 hy
MIFRRGADHFTMSFGARKDTLLEANWRIRTGKRYTRDEMYKTGGSTRRSYMTFAPHLRVSNTTIAEAVSVSRPVNTKVFSDLQRTRNSVFDGPVSASREQCVTALSGGFPLFPRRANLRQAAAPDSLSIGSQPSSTSAGAVAPQSTSPTAVVPRFSNRLDRRECRHVLHHGPCHCLVSHRVGHYMYLLMELSHSNHTPKNIHCPIASSDTPPRKETDFKDIRSNASPKNQQCYNMKAGERATACAHSSSSHLCGRLPGKVLRNPSVDAHLEATKEAKEVAAHRKSDTAFSKIVQLIHPQTADAGEEDRESRVMVSSPVPP